MKKGTINNIEYNISYSNIKNGRVKITSDGNIMIKIPYLMYLNNNIENILLQKGLKLLKKYNITKKNKLETITNKYVLIFGEKKELKYIDGNIDIYLKDLFIKESKELLDIYSEKINIPYNKLTVKYLKSKWGSCSGKNNISLNQYLVHLPKKYLEYVIIHEICHLKEKNHSKNFWLLVEVYSKNYKEIKNEMKNIIF